MNANVHTDIIGNSTDITGFFFILYNIIYVTLLAVFSQFSCIRSRGDDDLNISRVRPLRFHALNAIFARCVSSMFIADNIIVRSLPRSLISARRAGRLFHPGKIRRSLSIAWRSPRENFRLEIADYSDVTSAINRVTLGDE